MSVHTERLWAADDVQTEIGDALTIVAALDPPQDLRGAVFSAAVQALMQRQVVQSPAALGHPVMAIPQGRRH